MSTLSWNATEERRAPKTAEWFFAASIIAVALIATAIILGNALFAGVIALATLVFLIHTARAPPISRGAGGDYRRWRCFR